MKTIATIARELSVPVSTLRYRIAQYSEFIPSVDTSRGVEYSDESEGIIREINQLSIEKKSQEEILQILASKYARDIEVVATTTPTTAEQQPQNVELVRLNNNLERLIEAMNGQQELQRQINDLRSEFRESRMERNKSAWTKAKELLGW